MNMNGMKKNAFFMKLFSLKGTSALGLYPALFLFLADPGNFHSSVSSREKGGKPAISRKTASKNSSDRKGNYRMTKITDLFNKIDPSELETMGKILPCSDEKRLSPEEEERIFQNVCQKLQLSPEKKRKHFPRKRMGIFLAAATFLLSITVGAAEYFHLNPEFLQYFQAVSENERQTLKDMAALPSGPDNASPAASGHGVSICADQTISRWSVSLFLSEAFPPGRGWT